MYYNMWLVIGKDDVVWSRNSFVGDTPLTAEHHDDLVILFGGNGNRVLTITLDIDFSEIDSHLYKNVQDFLK